MKLESPRAPDPRTLPLVLWAAVGLSLLLLLTFASFRRISEADFWWQYATGALVAKDGVPHADTLSYVAAGRPWIELRWLYCLILHGLVTRGGFGAAVVVKTLAVIASFAAAAGAADWRRAPVAAAVVVPIAALASAQRFYVRPEIASFLLFAVFVLVLARDRLRGGPILFALPFLQALWANLHTLFLLGPALVGLHAVIAGVRAVRVRDLTARREAARAALVLALSLLACLLTPYGARGVAFGLGLVHELRDPIFREVSAELASPFSFARSFTAVWLYEALLAGCCALGIAAAVRRCLDPFLALVLLAQAALSATSIRNLPLFALAAVPFVVAHVSRLGFDLGRTARAATLVAVVAFSGFVSWSFATDRFYARERDPSRFGAGLLEHRFAIGATRFLGEHGVRGALFNSMAEGAYLTSRGVPVFIDPRLEVHGRERLERYARMARDEDTWRAAVGTYDFRAALVDLESPFLRYLTDAPSWRLVFFDDAAAVFVRAGQEGPPGLDDAAVAAQLARVREALPPARPHDAVPWTGQVDSPLPYLHVANFLGRTGHSLLAEPFALDAVAADPTLPGPHAILGQIAEARGDRDGALRAYETELALAPDDAMAVRQAGLLRLRAGSVEGARRLLERAVTMVPSDARAWAALTKIHADAGRTADALRCAGRAAALEPGNAEYVANLGRLYAASGRLDDAIPVLERALGLDPHDAGTYGDLAVILAKSGRQADAVATLDRGLAVAPSDSELRRLRAALAAR